jgi:hypothetical protein
MYKREPIEPMECDKKYDGNGATAVANMDDVLNKHDGLFEINRELIERNSKRKRNRSYEGDHIVVAPECHCIASPPRCDAASSSTALSNLLRHRTAAAVLSAEADGRAMTSNIETSSVLNVNAAPTGRQLREQPELTQLPPGSTTTDSGAAELVEHRPDSTTLGVSTRYPQSEVLLNEQPGQIVPEIDPTTATLQAALRILGSHEGFTTKVVTLKVVMMEMREVVKQQPRDQREDHWQRLLRYLKVAQYQLPEPPRQWPPDLGDETRNVRERGTNRSDGNVVCRDEQNGQVENELSRSQDRLNSVEHVLKDKLEKLCLERQMPWQGTCASNVRSRESSSRTMVSMQNCAGQIPVRQEGTGAPNPEQSCQQRIDLQKADGRTLRSKQPGVLVSVHGVFRHWGRPGSP